MLDYTVPFDDLLTQRFAHCFLCRQRAAQADVWVDDVQALCIARCARHTWNDVVPVLLARAQRLQSVTQARKA
jgi:hypothetical protein